MLKLLSLSDFCVALLLVYAQLVGAIHPILLVYAAIYLFVKAAFFWANWMSWVDALVGAWLVLLLLGASGFFSWVCAAWLVYKAVYALL